MPKRSSEDRRDVNEIATSILEQVTGNGKQPAEEDLHKEAARILGRLGGLKGGPARAKKLTAEQRKKIAQKAAEARWAEKKD